jgi:hypothetical protein
VGAFQLNAFEILVAQQNVLALGDLIALDQIGAAHPFAGAGIDAGLQPGRSIS